MAQIWICWGAVHKPLCGSITTMSIAMPALTCSQARSCLDLKLLLPSIPMRWHCFHCAALVFFQVHQCHSWHCHDNDAKQLSWASCHGFGLSGISACCSFHTNQQETLNQRNLFLVSLFSSMVSLLSCISSVLCLSLLSFSSFVYSCLLMSSLYFSKSGIGNLHFVLSQSCISGSGLLSVNAIAHSFLNFWFMIFFGAFELGTHLSIYLVASGSELSTHLSI